MLNNQNIRRRSPDCGASAVYARESAVLMPTGSQPLQRGAGLSLGRPPAPWWRRRLTPAIVVVVLVVAGATVAIRASGHSGQADDVSRAFQKAEPCGTRFLGLGLRFVVQGWRSRPGKSWSATRASHYGGCDPWLPGAHAVMWAEFGSIDDRVRATQAIGDDELHPYCVTATEVFFVDLDTKEQIREFCRDVGASEPVGEPLS